MMMRSPCIRKFLKPLSILHLSLLSFVWNPWGRPARGTDETITGRRER